MNLKPLALASLLPLAACLAPEPEEVPGEPSDPNAPTLLAVVGEGFSGTFETIECETGLCLALANGTAPGVSALSIATWNDTGNPQVAVFADSGTRYLFFDNRSGTVERDGIELARFTYALE